MKKVHKVIAYITRTQGDKRQLLVFSHRDYPEAGLQVPAGTVGMAKDIEAALAREVVEETGLASLRVLRKLAVYEYHNPKTGQTNERHIFHLAALDNAPDHWQLVETGGGRVSELEGYVFQFYWADLDGEIELAGNQGDYLGALREQFDRFAGTD